MACHTPDREGDIGADVLLVCAAPDRNDLPVMVHDGAGRRLGPAVRGFPGVECPPVPKPGRFGSGGIERVVPVHQHRPGRGRPGERIEGEEEDFCIPEHVTKIRIARQRSGADRDPLVGGFAALMRW